MTPQGMRLHVGIFGETNAGKSSLFNALTNTNISITSEIPGTTTDSVQKAMELPPAGPIVLVDTAGLNDSTELGQKRREKTDKILDRIDFALYVIDGTRAQESLESYREFAGAFETKNIPHLPVLSKSDVNTPPHGEGIIPISVNNPDSIDALKQTLTTRLLAIKEDAATLLGGLAAPGSNVVMVVPIDSASPKGRLILPQVQLIRDCLDNGCVAHVCTVEDLPQALGNLGHVDLVITDSQAFSTVADIVPADVKLTSFSILMVRQKGDIEELLRGIKAIETLKDGDNVLICEVCTHSRGHEDIGQVKIPAALRKLIGKQLNLEFTQGRDYPSDVSHYAMIIHCGGCMITPKEMKNRIKTAANASVPITNYGLVLAHASGVLQRCVEVLF